MPIAATILYVSVSATAGSAVGTVLAALPALHPFHLAGVLVLLLPVLSPGVVTPPEIVVPAAMGLAVGFSLGNTIPAILLAAPDESAMFTVRPGQKYLRSGHGYDAVMITAVGGVGGLGLLLVLVGPIAPWLLPRLYAVLHPHSHWIVWAIIVFMLPSDWPRDRGRGTAGDSRLAEAWRGGGIGLAVFLASGVLGLALSRNSPVSVEMTCSNLIPALAGLFAAPWLLINIIQHAQVPDQNPAARSRLSVREFARGVTVGGLGGGVAAFLPGFSGGVGGLLAGGASEMGTPRVALICQGASKSIYYAGALLLVFVPGLHAPGWGADWIPMGLIQSVSARVYVMALVAIAIGGGVSFALMRPLTRMALGVLARCDYRLLCAISLAAIAAVVLGTSGWLGLCIAVVAGGIGLVPILFGSHRFYCLGIVLLPAACDLSGIGTGSAGFTSLL